MKKIRIRTGLPIKFRSMEYLQILLNTDLFRMYDLTPHSREEHDMLMKMARESPFSERVEMFIKIYGRRNYAERMSKGNQRR